MMKSWHRELRAWEREVGENLPKRKLHGRKKGSEWLWAIFFGLMLVFFVGSAATGPDGANPERALFGQSFVFAAIGLVVERMWRAATQFQMVAPFYYIAPAPDAVVREVEIRQTAKGIAACVFLVVAVAGVIALELETSFGLVVRHGFCAAVAGGALSRLVPWSGRFAFLLLLLFAICSWVPPAARGFHVVLNDRWGELSTAWPPLWAYRETVGWEWPALIVLALLGLHSLGKDYRSGRLDRESFFKRSDGVQFSEDDDWDEEGSDWIDSGSAPEKLAEAVAGRPEALVWKWLSPREKMLAEVLSMRAPLWSSGLKWSVGWLLLSYALLLLGAGLLAPLFEQVAILHTIWNAGIVLTLVGGTLLIWPALGGFGGEWMRCELMGSLGIGSHLAAFPVSLGELISLRLKELPVRSLYAAAIYAGYSYFAMLVLGWSVRRGLHDFLLWAWTVFWAVFAFALLHLLFAQRSAVSVHGKAHSENRRFANLLLFLCFLGVSAACICLPFVFSLPASRLLALGILNPLAVLPGLIGLRQLSQSWRNPRVSVVAKEEV